MATIEEKTTHVADALARLLEQFKYRPNIEAVITALVSQLQDLENSTFNLYLGRWIDSADGVNLDNLGNIVGQARNGMLDTDYRMWIRARILSNRSNGRYDDLLEIAELILDNNALFTMTEEEVATLVAHLYGFTESVPNFFDILFAAKAAGVRFILEYSQFPLPTVFRFAPGSAIVEDSGYGFGVGPLAGALE